MFTRATDGTCLGELIDLAIPLCQAAAQRCPRTGPGRPPDYADWQIAALIMVSVLKKRKSKSSQHRFLVQNQQTLCDRLTLDCLPVRSTYFDRYKTAHAIFREAIALQGRKALAEHVACATTVSGDKSLLPARGPKPPPKNPRYHCCKEPRRGLDQQAAWGYSPHDGWVWGYSYEVVVSAGPKGVVIPLLASADVASANEHRTFAGKIARLPASTRNVLADSGYDDNSFGEQIEFHGGSGKRSGKRSGRRFVCPPQSRGGKPAVGRCAHRGARELRRQHRIARCRFYQSRRGRRLYALRQTSVEPFHQWFKQLFELDERVWHRGVENNQTQLLAALFCYQLLVRYAHRHGRRDGQIKWILDAL